MQKNVVGEIILMGRPKLTKAIDAEEFDSFYWYKEELIEFAGLLKVSSSGGKFELHDRISNFLRGRIPKGEKDDKPTSKAALIYTTFRGFV